MDEFLNNLPNRPHICRCECPPGHELAPNQRYCKDIDECSQDSGICSNGVCENMMGTYQCMCNDGYQQTGQKSHCEGNDQFLIGSLRGYKYSYSDRVEVSIYQLYLKEFCQNLFSIAHRFFLLELERE